jgi:hypothetical protein
MGNGFDVTFIGDQNVARAFKRLQGPEARKLFSKSALKALKPVLSAARAMAPKLTGKLAATMSIRMRKNTKDLVSAWVTTGTRQKLGIAADDPYYYPMAVEAGHGGPHPAPAHPFLRPAAAAAEGACLAAFKSELAQGIEVIYGRNS